MATIADLVTKIDDKQQALLDDITNYLDDLLYESSSIQGGAASLFSSASRVPDYIRPTPANLTIDGNDVSGLFEPVIENIEEFANTMKSIKAIPQSTFLGDPMNGWVGKLPLEPWQSTDEIMNQPYLDPLMSVANTAIQLLISGNNIKDLKYYVLRVQDIIYNNSLSIVNKNQYNKRCFAIPDIINNALQNTVSMYNFFDSQSNVKFMNYIIELTSKDYLNKATKYQIDLDKLQPEYAIIYGELYTMFAEYVANKANVEINWFLDDYKRRVEAQKNNITMNANHYTEYLENMSNGMKQSAEMNIKAIVTNYSNVLKELSHIVDMSKADQTIKTIYNNAAMSVYGMTLQEIAGRFANQSSMILSDKVAAISNLSALISGYKGLIAAVTSDAVGIVTVKE